MLPPIILRVEVKDSVGPLEAEIAKLQEQQNGLIERQEESLANASQFNDRVEQCRVDYARLIAEAQRIRQDITDSENNLGKAEHMLDSLGEEWNRWIKDMRKLNACADTV